MDATFVHRKDPDGKVTHSVRWYQWLRTNETISTSTWTVLSPNESPATLTVANASIGDYTGQSPILTNTVATAQFLGGTGGYTYYIVNHIVTSEGDEDDRTIKILVWDK